MPPHTSEEIRTDLSESLSLALLCSLDPAGISFETYQQKLGIVKYACLAYQTDELIRFISAPLYLASGVLPTLSDMVAYEMSFEHGLGSDGWLEIIAKYPFVFASYACCPKEKSESWEVLQDITFTHFIMFGGPTGLGNDVIGYVISQESKPGVTLESAAFLSPSSVIAPGYSPDHIEEVRQQEYVCMQKLLSTTGSVLSSFIDDVTVLDTSNIDLKVLYGVSTSPFNDIDKVISNLGKKKLKRPRSKKPTS